MRNKNFVTKNLIYGIASLTLLILAISLATQTLSNGQIPSEINGNSNNNNTAIFENNAYQAHNYVKLLAQDMENRLEKAAAILELTGMLPEVKNVTSVNKLDETIGQQKGLPQNADIPKRQVAKDILEKYEEFQVVFFLMPNGDIYIEEPYSLQENLSKSNFAFRDYYKGVIANNDTFLGNVIVSASSGQNQAVMAVPIYSGINGSLAGIWAGGLDMSEFNESLQLLNLTNNERIAYVDNLGKVVADSDILSANRNESFANLQGFQNAINGKSGTVKEIVNCTEMLVSYYPVKALFNNWAVLLIQPNNGNSVVSSSNYAITNNGIMENDKQKEMLLQNTSK
ncbi:cache domain-containing protein [Candidatus Nitrosocosmicus sp. T]